MELTRYLERVRFRGVPRPDLDTLTRLHRLHLESIPYENLDVQLRRPVGFDVRDIFDKLVDHRRGGWCYEMNGLFAWALEEIGFEVMQLAGAVVRDRLGDVTIGGHLVLCVRFDVPWLVDVGFGDGLIEPVPVAPASFRQGFFDFRLESLDAGWWRFHNHPRGGAPTFDFRLEPARAAVLAARCQWLQTAPESSFVQNAICQRHRPGSLAILRGRVLRVLRADGTDETVLTSADELDLTLRDVFGIELDEVAPLWDTIVARHAARSTPD